MDHEDETESTAGLPEHGWGRAALAAAVAALVALSLFPGPLHPPPLLAADPVSDYALLLAKAVKEDGVDYAELAKGRAALDAYVAWLGTAEPGATNQDRIAFWINAYNALVLRKVLDTKPKNVLGLLDGHAGNVAGSPVTWEGIEGILATFRQPLVHFALHRAARSSPPLAAVLYRGGDLAEALGQQARAYLSDEEQNRFGYAQLEAELSMLFLWHRADFEPLQQFLADRLPRDKEEIARSLRKTAWRISFRPWDWSLDEAGGGTRRPHPFWLALYAVAAVALLLLGLRAFRTLLRPPAPRAPAPPDG